MSPIPATEQIVVDGRSYAISELTEFGFTAPIELAEGQTRSTGVLIFGDHKLEAEFRVRRKLKNGDGKCSFVSFPIRSAETIRKYLKKRKRINSGNESLEERSYDELANGMLGETAATTTVAPAAKDPSQKSYVKSFALMAMLFMMLGLVVLAAVFLRSRSSLSVENSALVGNCLPVNAKVEGEVVEVLVNYGDEVRAGDVLLRLANPEIAFLNQQLSAQRSTAESKVATLKIQRKTFASKLVFASRKLTLDREVANSELAAAEKSRESAEAAYDRMKPFVESGAVTPLEMDEVENILRAAESICIAKQNLVRQINFSLDAAEQNVLIIGDRVDDELGRIDAELAIAEAEARELSHVYELAIRREKELDVVAPRDGTVYVTYRQPGEFVRIADELIGLSYPGKTWAAGQVTSAQASRVLPGQPVTVRVPAMNISMAGTVMAVGHRAMYAKGNYNADFRGTTATDVPVKVRIDDLPRNIPSGLRLEMAINTGFGIEWLDDAMGYELHPLGSPASATPVILRQDADDVAMSVPVTD